MNELTTAAIIVGILTSAVRLATPYLYAGIGEAIAELSGVVNLGVDGRAEDVGFGHWPMRLDISQALPLVGGRERSLASFEGQRVHAVAGIAHPERFFQMLRQRQIAVVPHAFADHHQFSPADFDFGSRLPVLMTEKDAVKCAAFAQPGQFSVPLQAELPEALWISLLDRLEQLRPR